MPSYPLFSSWIPLFHGKSANQGWTDQTSSSSHAIRAVPLVLVVPRVKRGHLREKLQETSMISMGKLMVSCNFCSETNPLTPLTYGCSMIFLWLSREMRGRTWKKRSDSMGHRTCWAMPSSNRRFGDTLYEVQSRGRLNVLPGRVQLWSSHRSWEVSGSRHCSM